MFDRFKAAAVRGVEIGLLVVIVLGMVAAFGYVVVGDYMAVRQAAIKGQQAYEYVVEVERQKRQTPAANQPPSVVK